MLAGSVVLGLLYLDGRPLLSVLPLPVLAGTMLVIALKLIDQLEQPPARALVGRRALARPLAEPGRGGAGLRRPRSGRVLPPASALGVLLSMVVFFVRMNRSLVRHRCTAAAQPSRRVYPAAVEQRLQPLRERVMLFELEGALFFGSGERLQAEADTLPPDCRCLVLDLRRVATIDETGAVALQQLGLRLRRRGVELLLAGLARGSAQAQALQSLPASAPAGPTPTAPWRPPNACCWAAPTCPAEVPLAESSLLQGLDAAQCEAAGRAMPLRRLAAGEPLFAARRRRRLPVRADARLDQHLQPPRRHGRTQRYLSISPGMIFGETAMLDGAGRSAGAVADVEATVHALSRQRPGPRWRAAARTGAAAVPQYRRAPVAALPQHGRRLACQHPLNGGPGRAATDNGVQGGGRLPNMQDVR